MKTMKTMKTMKIIFAGIFIIAALLFGTPVFAEQTVSLAEEYNVDSAADGLDYSAADFLAENGITPDSIDGISSLSPKTVLEYIWEKLCDGAKKPLRIFGMMISVIILSAVTAAAADTAARGGCERIYRTICVLTAVTVITAPLEQCLALASQTLVKGGDFMLCYVPVFAGICTAAGNAVSSASYNVIVLILAEAAAGIAASLIMPVVSVCMAMSIIDAVNPALSLSSIAELLRKWIVFALGFIMTVFSGLLSVQSIVGVSADTVGIKTAKFLVSNFVPIVGGAVADAYTTMRSGLGLLRGAAGAFGVIAIAVTLLPPVINIMCMYLAMSAGAAVSEMFGAKELCILFRGAASALSMVMAAVACFGVMFIIATVILMAAGAGLS